MVRLLLGFLLVGLSASARPALHTWTDKDGVLHVDDNPPPSPSRARSAPRKAVAPPAVARPDRWWEKRNDAPPDEIDKAAQIYNVPAELVRAVIWAESAGDAGAVSHAGAIGVLPLT